jgi:hypothetical protein
MLMFVLNPLRHIVATITTLIIFLKQIVANMGRDNLQCILTGAVLVDQVGNIENTCYSARFFKPIYLTHSTPLSILFGRSIHEVALSLFC